MAKSDDVTVTKKSQTADERDTAGTEQADRDLADTRADVGSRDLDGDGDGKTFTKKFTLLQRDYVDGFDHSPNFTGTTQDAVNCGLRLTGDVVFVGSEDVPDEDDLSERKRSVVLTYEAPVLPAGHPDAPVNVVDVQEVRRDGISEADERTPVNADQLAPRTGDAKFSDHGEDPEHVIK